MIENSAGYYRRLESPIWVFTSLTSLADAITKLKQFDAPAGHDGGLALCSYVNTSSHAISSYMYMWADADTGTGNDTTIVTPTNATATGAGNWLLVSPCGAR